MSKKDAKSTGLTREDIASEHDPLRVENRQLKSRLTEVESRLRKTEKELNDIGVDRTPLAEKERQQFGARLSEQGAEVKRLRSDLAVAEDIRREVFRLADEDLAPPKWIEPIPKSKKKGVSMPIMLISDEQVGEHIVANEVEGINHYDHNVYVERHTLCAQKLVEISEHHMAGQSFPVATIGFLGDAVNGEIHAELAETNTLQSIPAASLVVETRRNAIDFWLKHFDKLFIVCIPGNHGRTTPKPRFKRYTSLNYETLIGWWLKSLYANEPRVKIVVPPSGDYHCMVWSRGLFFTHGDRLGQLTGKGAGMGFAGPALPIARGSKNIREQQTEMGRKIDYIHIGHWHTRMEIAGTFANGAMAGYNEYAHGLRYRPAAAEQWLYYLHPDRGATSYWPIFLSSLPKAQDYDDIGQLMSA